VNTVEKRPANVIGVSMPRSGHHLIARLLQAALQDDLFYCEYYSEPRCCQAVPCARRGGRLVTFQKSHDFDLNLATDVADSIYLIQHRAPVALLLSAREHYATLQYHESYGDAIGSNRGEYAVWLGRQAHYYAAFSRRWLVSPPPNSVVVDYDELSSEPAGVLERLFTLAGIEVAAERIDGAVEATIQRAGRYGEHAYVPRAIDNSRYLDRELLAICESMLADELPHLAAQRVFDEVAYRNSVIWRVFSARQLWRDGDVASALAAVDEGILVDPDNGLLFHERAVILQSAGRYPEARDAIATAAMLLPQHPAILGTQADVNLTLGDVETARAAAEALVALRPREPVDPVFLALAGYHEPVGWHANRCVATIRLLEAEIVARDVARRARDQQLRQADVRVDALMRTAEERLRAREAADAESDRLREECGGLVFQLQQKDQEIANLATAAEERLRMIEQLTGQLQSKEQEIVNLAESAQERLSLVARAEADAARIHDISTNLIRQLAEKEQAITDLTATAEERLQLVERLDAELRQLRAALEHLTCAPPEGEHVATQTASG